MAKQTGTVKWFDARKGYGFIAQEGQRDVFVHQTEIRMDGFRKLEEGDNVEFEAEQTDKGLQARNVEVIEQAA